MKEIVASFGTLLRVDDRTLDLSNPIMLGCASRLLFIIPFRQRFSFGLEKTTPSTKRFFMKAMCPTALIVTYKAMMRRNAGKLMVKLPVRLLVLRPLSLGNLSPHLS